MLDNNVNTYYKPLAELSKLYGIQLAYVDVSKQRRQAPLETLLATLQSLGAPLEKPEHAADAIREKRDLIWRQCCEPVLVAWEGNLPAVKLNFAAQHIPGSIKWHLHLESGEELSWVCSANDFTEINSAVVNSVQYVTKAFPLGYNLPPGYHQLSIDLGNSLCSVMVISSPKKAFESDSGNQPYWGVFMPLYALRTRGSWGGGDFADLDALLEWVHGLGGRFVGTLPLLATFFQDTRDLSPYFPASRLFWSEVYLDMRRILQEENNPALAQMVKSPGFSQHLQALQAAALVDYRSQVQLKRSVLQHLATSSRMQQGTGPAEYYQYLQNNPRVDDYAEFRSAVEKLQAAWQYWPAPQKDGVLSPSDYNEGVKQCYLYAQWLLESQLKALTEKARKRDMRLYFDLPLGVSPQSYDVWRERESFVSGISAGAPPDGFFTKGQQWELSPLHPQGLRRQGYKYYIECLRHNFKYAGILRIDHIMAFHRLYVIPDGFEASQGAYIRYPCDEFYAIVTLESRRACCLVLGEDLGTVPTEVRKMMQRHQLYRHYVVQYEIAPTTPPLPDVPQKVIASINTHDMPTFTSFWQGNDVQERYNRGLLDNEGVAIEIKNRRLIRDKVINYLSGKGFINSRSPGTHEVLRGLLAFLSSSRAWAVMVNLEDLWGETQAQNVPGTLDEKLNYCRMLRYIFEEFTNMPQVVEALQDVSDKRRGGNL